MGNGVYPRCRPGRRLRRAGGAPATAVVIALPRPLGAQLGQRIPAGKTGPDNAIFRLPPRPDGLGQARALRRLRGGLHAELHAGLHGRGGSAWTIPGRSRSASASPPTSAPSSSPTPRRQGYTTVEASNGATLEAKWEFKRNIRPWSRSLYVGVVKDFLAPGDTITIRFGDRRQGSPGIRLQTYCESEFEFRVFADPIATYDYVALPESPKIAIVPGPGVRWRAVLPTLVRAGEPFRLAVKADDKWGNPSNLVDRKLRLASEGAPVMGLPDTLRFAPGSFAAIADGLRLETPGDCVVRVLDEAGNELARSNPLRAVEAATPLVHFWGDTHGQSNETLGTNTAREYFEFGRDKAFLDVMGHQGNDFQITGAFWRELNALSAEFDKPGTLRVHPGLRVVGQHGGGRRPQRALPARGRDHPSLLARADRRCGRHRDEHSDAHDAHVLFEKLAGQGLRGDGACRRALCRHQVRARSDGDGSRGALGLGHVRVDRARCVREGLPRRHRRQLGRAQGAARRLLSGRLVLRQLRRPHLLPGRAARPRRHLRVHAPAAALCDDGQPCAAERGGGDGIGGRGVRARPGSGTDDLGDDRGVWSWATSRGWRTARWSWPSRWWARRRSSGSTSTMGST